MQHPLFPPGTQDPESEKAAERSPGPRGSSGHHDGCHDSSAGAAEAVVVLLVGGNRALRPQSSRRCGVAVAASWIIAVNPIPSHLPGCLLSPVALWISHRRTTPAAAATDLRLLRGVVGVVLVDAGGKGATEISA